MASGQNTPTLKPILVNQGLQPIVTGPASPTQPIKVPITLLRETQKPILIEQNQSSSIQPLSPQLQTHLLQTNSHSVNKRNFIVVVDNEDQNKSKQLKLEAKPELTATNIENLKKQIEEEEAKLKLMIQMQSQKVSTTQTIPSTSFINSSQNKIRSKPIIIHGANDTNKNINTLKSTILINPDNHIKHNNILITRNDTSHAKHSRLETKPTIIHGALHADKMHPSISMLTDTLSPNGLEPEEFKELQELQSRVKSIVQRYSIPLPTSKHPNLFLSKHNHPRKHLAKMIERKLIKAPLPPSNRQVWPVIPFADNNFQYALGLEEAVLYVAGDKDESSALHRKNRVTCSACGSDFGSGWQGSKPDFYCEACDSAQQLKEQRKSIVKYLTSLINEVETDEREFNRYSELIAKQQTVLQQSQPQQQQQETFIISQFDGQYHIPTNAITLSNASGRMNQGTVIHQKQDLQYVTISASDANKLQPIPYFAPHSSTDGQSNPILRNIVYQIDPKTTINSSMKK